MRKRWRRMFSFIPWVSSWLVSITMPIIHGLFWNWILLIACFISDARDGDFMDAQWVSEAFFCHISYVFAADVYWMILHWSRNYLILVFYDDFLLGNHVPDAQPSEYSILPVPIQPYGGHGPWHIGNNRQYSRRSSPLRCNQHLEHSAVCNAPLASRIKHVLQCDTPINLRTIPRQSFYYSIFFKFLVYGNTAILETSWSWPI